MRNFLIGLILGMTGVVVSAQISGGGGNAGGGGGIVGGTCTNQAVTAISASGSPTCTTLTSSYVNNTIALTGTDINTSNQVTVTHLASALPVNQGGTGTTSTLVGILIGGSPIATYAGTSCTNQATTALSAAGAATCATITSAFVNNTIALTGTDINTSNQVTVTHLAAALPVNQGGTGTTSTLSGLVIGGSPLSTVAAPTGTVVGTTDTMTLTNKRITKRVTTVSDATSLTPVSDSADITYQLNTQATGTLTINNDTGTPTNGQAWVFKIKSTNVQTFAWGTLYVGGTLALPTTSTGGGKIDYFTFIYDTVNSKWQYSGTATGF